MSIIRSIKALSQWLSEIRIGRDRNASFSCADCPIVMSCGMEPREDCLPRAEAMAAGRRRHVEPLDTCITGGTM